MSLVAALRKQAKTCTSMGSPFTGAVLTILADTWDANSPLGQKCATFQGDIGPTGHSLPLRLAGGLHALVLLGRVPALVAAYPPNTADMAKLKAAILAAILKEEAFFLDWIDTPPQTNEVRRSAALIAMARVAVQRFERPIVLSELGASGGLNLMWDHFALNVGGAVLGPETPTLALAPDWTGPRPPNTTPQVIARAGVDLNPLDPRSSDDLLRLSAYLWADQPDRLARTRAVARVFNAEMHSGDAITWLRPRLDAQTPGTLHLIQNTVAWQYFPPEMQAQGTALIEARGAWATNDTPLAWMQMEADGGARGAALTLRLWPGNETLHLGRADSHGRWISWTGDAQG